MGAYPAEFAYGRRMNTSNVLAVFAHPDDESLSVGGFLAAQAAAGARVGVVTTTWSPESNRASELADALQVLGAGEPRMLGYGDYRRPTESAPAKQRLHDAPLGAVVKQLVGHIRAFRPDVVVTHDHLGGVTGHPDHLQTYRLTTIAAEAASWTSLHPETGPAWSPQSLWLATHPHSTMQTISELIGTRKALHSVPEDIVTTRLDVSNWLRQKVAAIAAHRSEAQRGSLPGVVGELSPTAQGQLLGTEYYIERPLHTDGSPRELFTGL